MLKFTAVVLTLTSTLNCIQVAAAGRPAPAVTLYEVKAQELSQNFLTTGTLKSINAIDVQAELSGKVTNIYFKPGQKVLAGDLLVSLDKREALANIKKLEAQLSLAKQQLLRQESLIKNRAASIETRDIKQADVSTLQASLEVAKLGLEKFDIKAAITGFTGDSDLVNGEWISANSIITTIDDTENLTLLFSVPEKHISTLMPGLEVSLSSVAWPNQSFQGSLNYIATRINQQRGTVDVEAIIPNSEGKLRPGMSVSVALPISLNNSALLVPSRSVTYQGEQATVMRINSEGKALPTTVQIGAELEEWIEVTQGIDVGDKIVDRGRLKAKPNAPVRDLAAPKDKANKGKKENQTNSGAQS